jgi:hypothetical protein
VALTASFLPQTVIKLIRRAVRNWYVWRFSILGLNPTQTVAMPSTTEFNFYTLDENGNHRQREISSGWITLNLTYESPCFITHELIVWQKHYASNNPFRRHGSNILGETGKPRHRHSDGSTFSQTAQASLHSSDYFRHMITLPLWELYGNECSSDLHVDGMRYITSRKS